MVFDPAEAAALAAALSAAAQAPVSALTAWDTTELERAMAELGEEARRGRGVFAHYG